MNDDRCALEEQFHFLRIDHLIHRWNAVLHQSDAYNSGERMSLVRWLSGGYYWTDGPVSDDLVFLVDLAFTICSEDSLNQQPNQKEY